MDEILRFCEKKLHCNKHELDGYSGLVEELLHDDSVPKVSHTQPEEKSDEHDAPTPPTEVNPKEVEEEDLEPEMPLDAYGCFYRDNLERYMTNNPNLLPGPRYAVFRLEGDEGR